MIFLSGINLEIGRISAGLAMLMTLAGVIVLALMAARLVWIGLAGAGADIAGPGAAAAAGGSATVRFDYSVLERATPFRATGQAMAAVSAEDVASDTPDTALSLTLHGVFGLDEDAIAYISAGQGAQTAYRRGDRIDGLSGVSVERILADTVLLRREGRLERLTNRAPTRAIVPLEAAEPAPKDTELAAAVPFGTPLPQTSPEPREDPPRRVTARIGRSELEELAMSLRIDPRIGGLDHGVSVFPTRNAALMQRAGLRAGDVVQRIGGVRIDDEADVARILEDIEADAAIEVSLVRGERAYLLTIRLDG